MSEEEIKKVIEKTVADSVGKAIKAELGEYKVPKEQHYLDHVFLDDWRKWQRTVKSSVLKAAIGVVITAFGVLLFYGFIFLGGTKP